MALWRCLMSVSLSGVTVDQELALWRCLIFVALSDVTVDQELALWRCLMFVVLSDGTVDQELALSVTVDQEFSSADQGLIRSISCGAV